LAQIPRAITTPNPTTSHAPLRRTAPIVPTNTPTTSATIIANSPTAIEIGSAEAMICPQVQSLYANDGPKSNRTAPSKNCQ